MEYPLELLPKSKYCVITSGFNNCQLIRFTSTNNRDLLIDPRTNQLKAEHVCTIESMQLVDLSSNLLGIFTVEHIQLAWIPDSGALFQQHWSEGVEFTDKPQLDVHFNLRPERGFFILPVSSLLSNPPIEFENSDNQTMIAECLVKHTPILGNFWHFSIQWNIIPIGNWNSLTTEDLKKKFKRNLGTKARSLICQYASL